MCRLLCLSAHSLPVAASISNGLLFLLIGGMAGSCDAALLRSKFTTVNGFKGIIAGVCCQFVLLPAAGFLSLLLFPLAVLAAPATALDPLLGREPG